MSKHNVAARPIYYRPAGLHRLHLTVVFATLAVDRRLEHLTDWSLK